MTDRSQLSDNAWARIQTLPSTTKGARLLKAPSCRRFVEAVLWILRTGAQWRMLPSCFGVWNSVFKQWDGLLLIPLGADAPRWQV
ncbi:transposase [Azotobacter sp. CWF10]